MNPDADVRTAFGVLQQAVDALPDPLILVEYGPRFDQKYLFMRLDALRTYIGSMGFDTSGMVDPS